MKNNITISVPLKGLVEILLATGDILTACEILDDSYNYPSLPKISGNWILKSVNVFKKTVIIEKVEDKLTAVKELTFNEWIEFSK